MVDLRPLSPSQSPPPNPYPVQLRFASGGEGKSPNEPRLKSGMKGKGVLIPVTIFVSASLKQKTFASRNHLIRRTCGQAGTSHTVHQRARLFQPALLPLPTLGISHSAVDTVISSHLLIFKDFKRATLADDMLTIFRI